MREMEKATSKKVETLMPKILEVAGVKGEALKPEDLKNLIYLEYAYLIRTPKAEDWEYEWEGKEDQGGIKGKGWAQIGVWQPANPELPYYHSYPCIAIVKNKTTGEMRQIIFKSGEGAEDL
jgi:hypothetical protein